MILVTGCAGFIGSHLCELLLSKGKEVIGIDNFNDYYNPEFKEQNIQGCLNEKNFRIVRASITDKKAVSRVFSSNEIETVVHLAAAVGVRPSLKIPAFYFEVNVNGTLNLLEQAKEKSVENFVFGSTSSIYGLNEKIPFSESDHTEKIISPYSASKRTAELLCGVYSNNYSIPVTCLRFFTVYGPRNRPDMAAFKFAKAILEGAQLERYGDGSMKRDFTFVSDIVGGIEKALKKPRAFEIVNLGNNRPIEVNRLIELIGLNLGREARIIQKPVPKGDVPLTYADISKAKRLYNWEPKVKIEQGIKIFCEWLQGAGRERIQ